MKNKPFVLIITAFNERAELPLCLCSLERQTFKNFRLILVDNNSTDSTIKIMNNFVSKTSIDTEIMFEKKQGWFYARNKALKKIAKMNDVETIAFSDADSFFESRWAEKIMAFTTDQRQFSFGYATETFKEDNYLRQLSLFRESLLNYTRMLFFCRRNIGGFMNGGNMCVRKNAFFTVGGFDNKWMRSRDTLLTVRLLAAGYEGCYTDADIWFSPRRLLGGNMQKWCTDKDIREYININGREIIKPIRVDQFINRLPTKDINRRDAEDALAKRSQRLFRRLLFLTLFENRQQKTLANIKNELIIKNALILKIFQKWKEKLYQNQVKIFKETETFKQYQMAQEIVAQDYQELINVGGQAIVKSVFPLNYERKINFLNEKEMKNSIDKDFLRYITTA